MSEGRTPRERVPYSAIVDRAPLKLPGDARMVVWTIVNVEEWDIEKAMARQYLPAPQGVATIPDVPNWAWHEYGMRVGFWRMYDALVKRKIRATTSINAHVCQAYPPVAEAMRAAGWDQGIEKRCSMLRKVQRASCRCAASSPWRDSRCCLNKSA